VPAGDSASVAEAASEVIIESREAQEGPNRPTWDRKTGLNTGEDGILERVDALVSLQDRAPETSDRLQRLSMHMLVMQIWRMLMIVHRAFVEVPMSVRERYILFIIIVKVKMMPVIMPMPMFVRNLFVFMIVSVLLLQEKTGANYH
jgi:hypothetical protein